MLLIVHKTRSNLFDLVQTLCGDEDKSLLLVGDAVNYASPFMVAELERLEIEAIYVAADALEAREIAVDKRCEIVDYDAMVALILEGGDSVVCV